MDCHVTAATARPWRWRDLYPVSAAHETTDTAVECRAFRDADQRRELNGCACDGCARIPENQR